MKAREIKELINFIANSGLEEVNIETEEIKLHIKRQGEKGVQMSEMVSAQTVPTPQAPSAATANDNAADAQAAAAEASARQDADKYVAIKSPMIGTFYRSPNPESGPFFNVGDSVKSGDVVCIIEAMKLFNEIESEVSGRIVKVLVENASPVEYDQPLFLVDPS